MTNLPGPIFTSPARKLPLITFGIALIVIGIWAQVTTNRGGTSIEMQTVTPSPSPATANDILQETAKPGDSIFTLAARAVNDCLSEHPALGPLEPVEHLWAVHQLQHSISPRVLHPGDSINFDHDAVSKIIASAKTISPLARRLLAPYLK